MKYTIRSIDYLMNGPKNKKTNDMISHLIINWEVNVYEKKEDDSHEEKYPFVE